RGCRTVEGEMMPELPEVETLCRQLQEILPGRRILSLHILDPLLGECDGRRLTGCSVEAVHRRGKSLCMEIGRGVRSPERSAEGDLTVKSSVLEIHLRMTGRLLWRAVGETLPPHTRLVITFSTGVLLLIDPRRFATFRVRPDSVVPPPLPDPLEGLPVRLLRQIGAARRLPVKSLLMDQRLIAGIGNIYACEILHHACVDPRRPSCSLSTKEWRKLAQAAAVILPRAVACRGTSISDWRDLFGVSGGNQAHLEVYAREGQPCRRCGRMVERIRMSGRGTWFCPLCQK
ncbi:MAG: DNA-formamidopyrimidine glycosylase family protein, partial [Thermodesulfobacteriota bacterium]